MAKNNFNKGLREGQNNPEAPNQMQPTPDEAKQMMENTPVEAEIVAVEPVAAVPMKQPIGEEEIKKAMETLRKYKKGKSQLEDKIVKAEKWWKMRHWDMMRNEDNADDPKPASGWLFNTIISKHADYMDSFPAADILPREEGDVEEAKRLSSIIPVVLKNNGFKKVYSEEVWYKLKSGTGVYGTFWDSNKMNGLGDITIESMDILSLFWEPGVKDIQKSENFFSVELMNNDALEQMYPGLELSKSNDNVLKKYLYDESIDTSNKSTVVDWYYKKKVNGKDTVQYVKFVEDHVLYATENDTQRPTQAIPDEYGNIVQVPTGLSMAEKGLYDHGMYPFVFDPLFPDADMPTGFGFVDVCKNAQASIDIFNNCFEKNVQFVCSPRFLSRNDGGINEEEFMNPHQLIVHVDGNLGEDSYRPIDPPTMINGNYTNILEAKIQEMKETAGNRDATTGGTSAGVTAASAIAAMQESAGKTSRDQISSSYERYKDVVYMVIELIRQFYDMPRQFRIIGENGQQQFTQYSNQGLQPQHQGYDFGVDMGYRLPVFDIEVKAEKENAYTQLSQNELALQFYNIGFFNPDNADQALACINMMEFQGKNQLISKIQENGTMYQQMLQMQQQMLQMAQMIDMLGAAQGKDYQMASQMADNVNARLDGGQVNAGGGSISMGKTGSESNITAQARERANSATAPR